MRRVLIITGASKGIGRATAHHFLESGHKVINISRTGADLQGVFEVTADLSNPAWLSDCGDRILEIVGDCDQIDLIHCAACLCKDDLASVSTASLQYVLQIGILAPVQLNQLLLPKMKAGSSIIYVGSTLSEKAVPNAFSYVVSKHAVVGMMRSTCQDLIGRGIHTMCVCPGFTDTEMLRKHVGGSDAVLDSIAGGVAFNRLIEPDEIAKTLYFCATNPVVNGAVIHANLGQIES